MEREREAHFDERLKYTTDRFKKQKKKLKRMGMDEELESLYDEFLLDDNIYNAVLDRIHPRYKTVFSLYMGYGSTNSINNTYETISHMMDITQERVRQMLYKVMEYLNKTFWKIKRGPYRIKVKPVIYYDR